MKKEDISHLARLSRIRLSAKEIDSLESELPKILEYVSVVSDISGDSADDAPTVGARHNILRKDEVTNEPGFFKDNLLLGMPETQNGFLKVKKILHTEE